MENKRIYELRVGEPFVGFFLLRKAESKLAANGNKYLDLLLGDATGEISARLWDCKPEEEERYRQNELVKVKGSVNEWQGKKQVKIDKIRLLLAEDPVEIQQLIPAAPLSAEVLEAELLIFLDTIQKGKLKELLLRILDPIRERLRTHPAALQNHHAIRTGLLYHLVSMLRLGEKMAQIYPFLNTDLLYAGIVLHDLAKLEEIEASPLGVPTEYTFEGQLLGHIVQGIKKIEKAAVEVGLDEETAILLQHMVLAHHYEPEFGSPKRPMFPEAEMLHYLDIIDARMYDMQKALSQIEGGEFTDKVWVLHNRKLYKPSGGWTGQEADTP